MLGSKKPQKKKKNNIAEMMMLRWMSKHTRQNRIRNKCIKEKVRVASIVKKMIKYHLKWFGHVW